MPETQREEQKTVFASLDALAEAFPVGLIRYRAGDREPLGRIVGYVYGLPEHAGEPHPPSLVILCDDNCVGVIYPHEVTVHAGLPAVSRQGARS